MSSMALPFSSLDNTAAKILVNISKMWDNEVGDGRTERPVFAFSLWSC